MNKKMFSIALAGIAATTWVLLPKQAVAYQGDPSVQGPNYTVERHETMTKAFANNDFATWKSQMSGRGRVTEVVNEQNFAKFAQAHKLATEGKMTEANAIRAELGLGQHNGSGRGQGMGNRNNR
jgi:hypothetical protein